MKTVANNHVTNYGFYFTGLLPFYVTSPHVTLLMSRISNVTLTVLSIYWPEIKIKTTRSDVVSAVCRRCNITVSYACSVFLILTNNIAMDGTILCFVVYLFSVLPGSRSDSTATIFEATRLPQNYLMASVGNGYIATNVYSDTIYVSGIFNGRGTTAPSHRARIPSTCDVKPRTNVPNTTQLWSLNVAQAVFRYTQKAVNFTLEQKIYAHRVREHIIVNHINVRNSQEEDILVAFDTSFRPISNDFDFEMVSPKELQQFEKFENTSSPRNYKVIQGHIKETEEPGSPRQGVAVVWTDVPRDPVTVPKHSSQQWYFVTSVSSSLNSEDFVNDALRSYQSAVSDLGGLYQSHVQAWTELWDQGRIDVEGNIPLAQAVYGSWYYILR